ncbi:hypothetical protein ACFW81_07370 [Streptomyces angustmyceticus]|uniref:hypothetical protein n=1 Tax=Streptomyces angustmyceticus TaxID=285578 RepID=UPI0021AE5713|nr:hypothetical protein [Streptomyces angustmyceticus]
MSQPNRNQSLLSQRAAIILLLGALAAIGATVLTILAGGSMASGLLAGGGAFGVAVLFFNTIIS